MNLHRDLPIAAYGAAIMMAFTASVVGVVSWEVAGLGIFLATIIMVAVLMVRIIRAIGGPQ